MTEQTFKECMTILQAFSSMVEKDVYRFLWNKFKHVSDDDFKRAADKILETYRPTSHEKFPAIERFVTALGNTEDNRINLAIGAVRKAGSTQGPYKSISFGDRALHAAVMRFGGWPAVSCWSDEEWKFREKSFIQAYKAEMTTGQGPNHLMGLSEETFDNESFNWPIEKRIAAEKTIKPVQLQWTGYKLLIENKAEKEPLKISQEVNDIISKIGKDVPDVQE